MTILIAGLVVFFGMYVVPMFPDFKGSLQSRFGATRFNGICSLIALSEFAVFWVVRYFHATLFGVPAVI